MVDRLIAPDQLPGIFGGKAPVVIPTGLPLPLQSSFLPQPPTAALAARGTNASCNGGGVGGVDVKGRDSGGGGGGEAPPGLRRRSSSSLRGRLPTWPPSLSLRLQRKGTPPTAVPVPRIPLVEAQYAAADG